MKNILPDRNTLFVSIGFFLVFFGFGAGQQYLIPLLTLQGRESLAFASLIVLYFTFFFAGIIAPRIIPKIGLKTAAAIGAFTYAFFTASVALNFAWLLIAASVLIGFGAALLWISGGEIINNSSSEEKLGSNLGFQFTSYLLGNLFGIAFGGVLLKALPLDQLYYYFSGAILLGIPFFLFVRLEKDLLREQPLGFGYVFNKKLLLLFPVIFAAYFLTAQTFAAINLVVLALFGIASVGVIATVLRVFAAVGSFAIGRITGKYKKENLLAILALVGLIGSILFITNTAFTAVIVAVILIGIFIAATYPVCLSLMKENISKEQYVYALGAFQVYTTVGVLGALVSARFFSPTASFLPGVIVLAISLPGIFLFGKARQ